MIDHHDHTHFIGQTQAVASEPFAFINGLLQNLMANDGILEFLPNWQQFSALHRFVAFIADEMFMSDCDGPRLLDLQPDERERRLVLPVDAALLRYGISDDPFFRPSLFEATTPTQESSPTRTTTTSKRFAWARTTNGC